MGSRIVVWSAPFFDGKWLWAIAAIKLFEPVHWYPRCTSNELKYSGAHFGIERQYDL